MSGHGSGFVVARSTRHCLWAPTPSEEVPLVLVEAATAVCEARPTAEDEWAHLRSDANFLEQLASSSLRWSLTFFDASAGRIPIPTPLGMRVEE